MGDLRFGETLRATPPLIDVYAASGVGTFAVFAHCSTVEFMVLLLLETRAAAFAARKGKAPQIIWYHFAGRYQSHNRVALGTEFDKKLAFRRRVW